MTKTKFKMKMEYTFLNPNINRKYNSILAILK